MPEEHSDEARRPGRPPGPSASTSRAVLSEALRLLVEEGADAVTPQRIHEGTGISRSTVYRNWPDRVALLSALLAQATRPPDPLERRGELAHDLSVAMGQLVWRCRERPLRAVLAALTEWSRTSTAVADLGRAYVDGLVAPFRTVIAEAVVRGEISGDPSDLAVDVAAPILVRHTMLGLEVTDEMGQRAVERFLAASGAARPAGRAPGYSGRRRGRR